MVSFKKKREVRIMKFYLLFLKLYYLIHPDREMGLIYLFYYYTKKFYIEKEIAIFKNVKKTKKGVKRN